MRLRGFLEIENVVYSVDQKVRRKKKINREDQIFKSQEISRLFAAAASPTMCGPKT